ncbi:primosomal protein N' [Lactococcus termiticola]|uniref:Replication restart protein PriA n=1 Tax=Lactococcus termiticola TaxID=2169526 RepID=A0A2R5HGC9_9LACT|nr:primosomal protein N' [Lactococcus termiticola]GBG97042.1 primosomal protein N' [Lactococcus termiticola]
MINSERKIAEVIVDVPLMQTDKPFSYAIPEHLAGLIEVGMRVHVPFGSAGRLVQGLVVGFLDDFNGELKEIVEVLDLEPVLTEEQLWLADEMRHNVFSYKISCLKAMLPNLLNSSYDKVLVHDDGSEELWSSLSPEAQQSALKAVKAGEQTVRYLAKSKENRKTEKWLTATDKLADFDFGNRSKKRLELRDMFLGLGREPIRKKDLPFSREVIKFFIDNDLLKLEEREVNRLESAFDAVEPDQAKQLNAEQATAFQAIISDRSRPFLLEGITGSGKTEVYLQVIEHFLKQGKTAIMLVPEISLTPQMSNRFIARFGKQVAIMHSGLSDGEKYDEWRKIRSGEARVVVGARSAIFVPLTNIGVIIIDEEHEASYKQDSNPRYHARDIALLRAKRQGAALVMGSATPSLESRARAQRDVYQLLTLTQRANPDALLPKVEVIDMRSQINEASANFSKPLLAKIAEKLERKEQVILMLNRRGYSSFVMCRDCGHVVECPNCDISLTLHMDTKTLNCHYCGHTEAIPQVCPNCQSRKIRYYGSGTQKVQEELEGLMPEVKILRMDVDTTKTKNAHERILADFGEGKADILLGTQMIAKGLDFPNVTLVGVINADTGLNLPDFRASERTFDLLMQVAGRAGRADKLGEVLIQTFNPGHYAIALAQAQDYEGFYAREMAFRQKLAYPPYYFTVQVLVSHKDEQVAVKKSYEIAKILAGHLTDKAKVLGPIPKPIARTHNLYHYQLLIKYRFEDELEEALNEVLDLTQERENRDLRVIIDSEPQNFV